MNRNHRFFAATGIPSLFLVFAVLCLAVLSLLTLGNSRSMLSSARLSMEQTDSYYKACADATATVTSVEKALADCYHDSGSETDYFSLAGKLTDKFADLTWDNGAHTFSFQIPVSDTQALSVILEVIYPSAKEKVYINISQWKTDNTTDWNPDTSQSVYKGGRS